MPTELPVHQPVAPGTLVRALARLCVAFVSLCFARAWCWYVLRARSKREPPSAAAANAVVR